MTGIVADLMKIMTSHIEDEVILPISQMKGNIEKYWVYDII